MVRLSLATRIPFTALLAEEDETLVTYIAELEAQADAMEDSRNG